MNKILIATDTYEQVNGVSTTYKNIFKCSKKKIKIIHPLPRSGSLRPEGCKRKEGQPRKIMPAKQTHADWVHNDVICWKWCRAQIQRQTGP